MSRPTFFLGCHQPHWLGLVDRPLFVSHRRLAGRKTLPRARGPWALDSGGFTELSLHGRWQTEPAAYVDSVRRYMAEIGGLVFASAQDWMCEPFMLAKTGLKVQDHQVRTVENYLELCRLGPEIPWLPVLQGFGMGDYGRCLRLYRDAGVDLTKAPRVGVGSVCRRQNTLRAALIFHDLADEGLAGKMHAFGLKLGGLRSIWPTLGSLDSMAWSIAARRRRSEVLAWTGSSEGSDSANSLDVALAWGEDVDNRLAALADVRRTA